MTSVHEDEAKGMTTVTRGDEKKGTRGGKGAALEPEKLLYPTRHLYT